MAVVKPETPAPTMTVSRTSFSLTDALAVTPGAVGEAVAATTRWIFNRRVWPVAMSFVPAKTALELPSRAAFPLKIYLKFWVGAVFAWVAHSREL